MKIPRFRLRTVMIFVAIVGVGMASILNVHRRLMTREAAIRAVDQLHGTYGIKMMWPEWFRSIVLRLGGNERMFYDPSRVSLGPLNAGYDHTQPIRDSDIEGLADHLTLFSNLKMLDLQSNKLLTDRFIGSLPTLPKLEEIVLSGNRGITEAGISELHRLYPNCVIRR